MAKVKVTYWKEIPVFVMVMDEGERASVALPDFYMKTVDGVAMRTGETDSTAYAKNFHYDRYEQDGDINEVAESVSRELQQKYPREWLKRQWKLVYCIVVNGTFRGYLWLQCKAGLAGNGWSFPRVPTRRCSHR